MRTLLRHGHSGSCLGEKQVRAGKWATPWFWTGEIVWGDPVGRVGPRTTQWLVLECNTVDDWLCPAQLLVSVESIVLDAPSGIKDMTLEALLP